MNQENTEDLLETIIQAQNFDEQAMTSLLEAFKPLLLKYSTNMYTNEFDEDCYQELSLVFVTAVTKFNESKYLT